jgi:hypothetical protein
MYEAMLGVPGIAEDLRAMLAATRPDRRDVGDLCRAIARHGAEHPSTGRALLEAMLERCRDGTLNAHDLQLLVAFLREAPDFVTRRYNPLVDRALAGGAFADPEACTSLSEWLGRTSQADRARRLRRWIALSAVIRARRPREDDEALTVWRAWLDPLQPDGKAAAASRLLELTRPVPVDAGGDALLAARLRLAAALNMRETPRLLADARKRVTTEASYPRLAATAARVYASQGNADAFEAMLTASLKNASSGVHWFRDFDVREALCQKAGQPETTAIVDQAQQAMQRLHEQNELDSSLFVRQLCLLGIWCSQNKLSERAGRIAASVEALKPTQEDQLWQVDLLDAVGDGDRAREIELQLARDRRLPMARLEPLLGHLRRRRGATAAARLAREVSAYCKHPSVLGNLNPPDEGVPTLNPSKILDTKKKGTRDDR